MALSLTSRLLLALVAVLISVVHVDASHAKGGEISYEAIVGSSNRYHVTVKMYEGFGPGVAETVAANLTCSRGGCAPDLPGSFVVPLTLTKVSPLNSLWCARSSNSRIIVFEADVQLPPGRWFLSTTIENRNAGIVNISNSADQSQYLEAQLDNSTGLKNSSAQFVNTQIPNLQGNQQQDFSFSAFDPDGDSLVYKLVTPLKGGSYLGGPAFARCATPVVGFAPSQFQLHAATGEARTAPFPLLLGSYAMAVKVEEYRLLATTWTLIGTTTRDITYTVNAGGNSNPSFTTLQVGGRSQPFETVIKINPGQTASVLINATDTDAGQALRFTSEATVAIPGVSLQTVSPTQARLTWQVPANLPLGRYHLPVTVMDDGCPILGSASRSLTFQVTNQVLLTNSPKEVIRLPAYPTPFQDQVQFQLTKPGAQKVIIVDGLGRMVEQLTTRPDGSTIWRPSGTLAPGLYLARTTDGRQLIRLLRE